MILKYIKYVLLSLLIISQSTVSYWNTININNTNVVLTRNVSYNITVVKKKFYHNNIPIWSIIQKYIKWYNDNLNNYVIYNNKQWQLTTKPIISLLNWFLTIESWIDNFWWKIYANAFFKLTSNSIFDIIKKDIFNYNINILSYIKNKEKREYYYNSINRNTVFYCNIWNAISNWTDIIYIRRGKDISTQIMKRYNWKRNRIWQKISMCKIINQFLLNSNYRKNLYYFLNAKSSYVWAILPFQMMPNNLYHYLTLYKQNYNVDLSNIVFYYKFMSLFLFGKDYNKVIQQYNKHFNTPMKLNECIKSIRYDTFCIYIKKQIFRYNHANRYVKRVMKQSYYYQQIDDLWLFVSPIKNLLIYHKEQKMSYLIHNIKTIITQWYKWLKHWGIDLTILNNYFKTKDVSSKKDISLIYNLLNPMNCYFIPYNPKLFLSKDIWNVIFCNNKKYWILYWHVKGLDIWIKKIEKKYMWWSLINKFIFQLVWKKTNKKGLSFKYYLLKWIVPWKKIAYMWNTWLKSRWLHLHYSIVNFDTHKFIVSNNIYNLLTTIKYYKW